MTIGPDFLILRDIRLGGTRSASAVAHAARVGRRAGAAPSAGPVRFRRNDGQRRHGPLAVTGSAHILNIEQKGEIMEQKERTGNRSHKKIILYVFLAVLSVICSGIVFLSRNLLRQSSVEAFDAVSYIEFTPDGGKLVIDDGNKTLFLLDRSGMIVRRYNGGDMSGAFWRAAKAQLPNATVCLDKFHVVALVKNAFEDARRRVNKRPGASTAAAKRIWKLPDLM